MKLLVLIIDLGTPLLTEPSWFWNWITLGVTIWRKFSDKQLTLTFIVFVGMTEEHLQWLAYTLFVGSCSSYSSEALTDSVREQLQVNPLPNQSFSGNLQETVKADSKESQAFSPAVEILLNSLKKTMRGFTCLWRTLRGIPSVKILSLGSTLFSGLFLLAFCKASWDFGWTEFDRTSPSKHSKMISLYIKSANHAHYVKLCLFDNTTSKIGINLLNSISWSLSLLSPVFNDNHHSFSMSFRVVAIYIAAFHTLTKTNMFSHIYNRIWLDLL